MWWRDDDKEVQALQAQAAQNSLIAERLMGLQTILVGAMAVALFALFRRGANRDGAAGDSMCPTEEEEDEKAEEAERRVALAAVKGLSVVAVCVAVFLALH